MEIWTAWLQGRDKAPKHVQRIFELWEAFNPNHRLNVLERSDADDILSELGIRQPRITPQVTTNIMRTYLLATRGGVWVDATVLPVMPLDDWLTNDLKREGFFAFRTLGNPHLHVQNWFLYGKSGNYLLRQWLDLYADYFRSLRRYPTWKRAMFHLSLRDYMRYKMARARGDSLWHVDPDRGRSCVFYPYAVHNFNFSYLLETDHQAREIWDRIPRKGSQLPSLIGGLSRVPDTDPAEFLRSMPELLSCAPVHKLNHQDPIWFDVANSVKPLPNG